MWPAAAIPLWKVGTLLLWTIQSKGPVRCGAEAADEMEGVTVEVVEHVAALIGLHPSIALRIEVETRPRGELVFLLDCAM